MGLEISKITNAELLKLAQEKDVDGNGVLDEKEFNVFEQEADRMEGISHSDFKKTMGLYTTDAITSEEDIDFTKGMSSKQAKKWNKEANEAHIEYLEYFVKQGGTLSEVLEALDDNVKAPQFKKAVEEVLAVMPTYTSSKEVGKVHKAVLKQLEARGLKDKEHEKILEQLEKMAKNECVAKAMSEIAAQYKEKTEKAEGKQTPQKIMDEIKAEAKKAGRFTGDYKEAYKQFNQPTREAYMKVLDAISQVEDKTKGKQVQNAAKDILKANGDWDKYTKKALYGDRNIFKRMGNWAKGYKNDGRIASDVKGRMNNVEQHIIQSDKEVQKAMGKKLDVFIKLAEAGIVTRNADGTWDLSELSELIRDQIGTDYRLNREHKKDKEVAEIANVQSKLEAIQGLADLSESEAKALIKLCGFDIEGKNVGRAIFGSLIGAVAGAGVGLGAAKAAQATLPNKFIMGGSEIKLDPIHLETELDLSKLKDQKLPEGVSVDASGSIIIDIALLIKEGTNLIDCSKLLGEMALRTALPTALVGAALGLLEGLKDKGQEPVLSVGFEETTYEDYCKMLESGPNKEYAPIGKLIAGSFIDENGKWDREGYKDFLNKMSGNHNTLLNREELIGGLLERQKELKNKKPDGKPNTEPTPPCEEDQCEAIVTKEEDKVTETKEKSNKVHTKTSNVGWKEIVEAYYPCLIDKYGKLYGNDGAIRALQRALCTDENGNLDEAALRALKSANDVPDRIILPLKVDDCDLVQDATPTPGKYRRTRGTGRGFKKGAANAGRDQYVTTRQVTPGLYIAKDSCDGTTASGSSKSEAVANLQKTTGKKYKNQ